GIPTPPPDLRPDAVLRMAWPFHFQPDPAAGRTFVQATCETLAVDPRAIAGGRPARLVLPGLSSQGIVPSHWSADGLVSAGAAPGRGAILPHGVDPSVFHPLEPEERTALRRRLGWEGRFVVLNVGAMTPNKGIAGLLRAVAGLAGPVPETLLVLKGCDA